MKPTLKLIILVPLLALGACSTAVKRDAARDSEKTSSAGMATADIQKLTISYLMEQDEYRFDFERKPSDGVQPTVFRGRSAHNDATLREAHLTDGPFQSFLKRLQDWVDTQRQPASSCRQPVEVSVQYIPHHVPETAHWSGCRSSSENKSFAKIMRDAEFLMHTHD